MLRTGKWNVLGLDDPGKMDILLNECKRYNINIIAVTELHWQGSDRYELDNWDVIYSSACGSKRENSVGVIKTSTNLSNEYVSDRLVIALFKCLSTSITLIGRYAPNNREDNPEVLKSKDTFFCDLNNLTGNAPKQDVLIVIGYLNNPAPDDTTWRPTIGKHTLGDINENGIRLLPYGLVNNIVPGGPTIPLKNARKHTSKHQEVQDEVNSLRFDRNLITKQWKNSLKDVSVCEAATIRCDRQLVVDVLTLSVVDNHKKKNKIYGDLSSNKDQARIDIREIYSPHVNTEGTWNDFVECVKTVKRELTKCRKENKDGDWISEHSKELFRKHKQAKMANDRNTCIILEEELKASLLQDKNTW